MPSIGPFSKPISTYLKADLDRLANHFDLTGNIKTLWEHVKAYVDARARCSSFSSDQVFAALFAVRENTDQHAQTNESAHDQSVLSQVGRLFGATKAVCRTVADLTLARQLQ